MNGKTQCQIKYVKLKIENEMYPQDDLVRPGLQRHARLLAVLRQRVSDPDVRRGDRDLYIHPEGPETAGLEAEEPVTEAEEPDTAAGVGVSEDNL